MSGPIVKYQGNCHCGAVKFFVELPQLKKIECCNCSLCTKKAIMWEVTTEDKLSYVRGESHLKVYQFGKGFLAHKFCPTCGVQVVTTVNGHPDDSLHVKTNIYINIRCLMDVDPWSMDIVMLDFGKSGLQYVPPPFEGTIPTPDTPTPNQKVYTGSCHCGLVRLALMSSPLPTVTIKEDNCSICIRHGSVFVYPSISQVSITGTEHLSTYSFGRKFAEHCFCSHCGTATHIKILGPPKEIQNRWSDEVRERNKKNFDMMPITLRILDGVEWSALKVERDTDEASKPPLYTVD